MSSSRSYFPATTESRSAHSPASRSREVRESSASTASTISAKMQKKNVLRFFTLKEPSASALEDFAAQQRKSGKAAGSSQKLPSHVPAVNSRWNGLPETSQQPGSTTSDSRPPFVRRASYVPALDSDRSVSPPSSRGTSPLTPPCEELSRTHLNDDDTIDGRKAGKRVVVRDHSEALPWEMIEPPPERPSPE